MYAILCMQLSTKLRSAALRNSCSENAAKCNAISVLCIWISDKKESDKMKTIDDDIRSGNFKQIYLLYGTEAYLKKQYKDKLKNAMAAPDDNMNFTTFEGKNINPKEVIDLAETLPFFADRRVILIEDSGFFKSSCEDLAEYLTQVAPATHFIFVEEEVDKRSKMYKTVKNNGKIVEFSAQSEELLTRWILTRLKKEGKNITGSVMQLFLSRTGTDMGNIDRELEKLICYALDRE